MNTRNEAPLHLIVLVLALVLLFLGAFAWPAPVEPWRVKLVAAGLFFWCLSTFL
jgi:hypothetical protein